MRKESCIAYQNGEFWAERTRQAYQVWRPAATVCHPDSAYPPTADGLSLAVARVDYLAKHGAKNVEFRATLPYATRSNVKA